MALLKYALAASVLAVTACSLAYDWDEDGQPCRSDGSCNDGFSCFRRDGVATTECVRDGSRRRGEECTEDAMCDVNLACAGGACRQDCGASYFSPTACRGDEFCKPYPGLPRGYCTQTECTGEQCPSGRICANIKDNVGACLVECNPSFNNETYSDNCGSTSSDQYCQAVGTGPSRRLVCLDTDDRGQRVGLPCNSIDNPCAAGLSYTDTNGNVHRYGLTCVRSVCVELCDPTAPNLSTNTTDCGASASNNATFCCVQRGALDSEGISTEWGYCLNIGTGASCDSNYQ